MKRFIINDYLLSSTTAKTLYCKALENMPIFDYHCHISAKEIFENKKYSDITELWLKGDHYKWRAMRSCGVSEDFITGGSTSNFDKFKTWAKVLPKCIGNVLYNWSMMELSRAFGIDEILSDKNSERLWHEINEMLAKDIYTSRNMLKMANVSYLNTTDDPIDTLIYHDKLKSDADFDIKIMPTWRPDRVIDAEHDGYPEYIEELGMLTSINIGGINALKKALSVRMDHFNESGCVSADHSLDYIPYNPVTETKLEEIFDKLISGEKLASDEKDGYKTEMLTFLAREYSRRGWVMELHIGALRDNNARMFEKLGQNGGFDSINDLNIAMSLSGFLNRLDYTGELPKTVIFALNPKDYYVVGSMTGNFQTDEIPGKIQFGSAWWFNDHVDGIRKNIKDIANISVLSNCIGMVTDSRCILSMFSRHELYRRILCDIIGDWVEKGLYANDMDDLTEIVKGISFYNAKRFFDQ